jgi:hypothetical protein
VLYVPRLAGSLISVLQLQDKGITIRTTVGPEGNRLLIKVQGVTVGVADRIGKSYALNSTVQGQITGHMALEANMASTDSQLWHRRFGHLSTQSLQHVHAVTTGLLEPVAPLQEACEACTLTKTVRVINRKSPKRATAPL